MEGAVYSLITNMENENNYEIKQNVEEYIDSMLYKCDHQFLSVCEIDDETKKRIFLRTLIHTGVTVPSQLGLENLRDKVSKK